MVEPLKFDEQGANAMLQAIADFLKANGWTVVVVGTPRVQKPPTDREFNFEFVVQFTGAPPAAHKPKGAQQA